MSLFRSGRVLDGGAIRSGVTLPVVPVAQVIDNWCWAACLEMLLTYWGLGVDKCNVADSVLSPTRSCCCDGNTTECNVMIYATDVSDYLRDEINFSFTIKSKKKVKFEHVKDSIDDCLPVLLLVDVNGLGAHMVLAHGWRDGGVIEVIDPDFMEFGVVDPGAELGKNNKLLYAWVQARKEV